MASACGWTQVLDLRTTISRSRPRVETQRIDRVAALLDKRRHVLLGNNDRRFKDSTELLSLAATAALPGPWICAQSSGCAPAVLGGALAPTLSAVVTTTPPP
mmetsp:Transcript_85535/g.277002  ORF Transcript_85535/g.277002 Transcript_85535/m.277002 type:complete len:102 (+) Transcript_85535:89-394(+)